MFCLFWSTLHPFFTGSNKEEVLKWRYMTASCKNDIGPGQTVFLFLQTIFNELEN